MGEWPDLKGRPAEWLAVRKPVLACCKGVALGVISAAGGSDLASVGLITAGSSSSGMGGSEYCVPLLRTWIAFTSPIGFVGWLGSLVPELDAVPTSPPASLANFSLMACICSNSILFILFCSVMKLFTMAGSSS